MTSQLLSAGEGEIKVSSWLFLLAENAGIPGDDADPPETAEGIFDLIEEIGDPGAGVVATGGDGGLILWSAGNDHYPHVRLEQWSGPPSPDGEEGGSGQTVAFRMRETGELVLTEISGDPSEDVSPLVLPGLGDYWARVHVRGRDEASGRGEAQFYHGVERWLVRIWPR